MANFNLSDYQTVQERVNILRDRWPECRTTIEIVHLSETDIIVKASLYLDPESHHATASDLAHEVKDASPVNRSSWVENAATSALGRCISHLGGDFSPKAKKPSREEMAKVVRMTAKTGDGADAILAELNATGLDGLSLLWSKAVDAGVTDQVQAAFTARKKALT